MLGIKERLKYKDIAWLMPSIDVESVLEKMNCHISHRSGDEIRTFCPDHNLFVGRNSSDPNFTVNTRTGETFCFTEGRGSNLVWIVCRLMECPPSDAVKFLTGADDVSVAKLDIARRRHSRRRLVPSVYGYDPERGEGGEGDIGVRGLGGIIRDIENRNMSEEAYDFFLSPPCKQPTNITRDTVDRYLVFERTWGMYAGRVIIPFFLRSDLVGFCAIDMLGKKEWLCRHPSKQEGEYKKTLYPWGFSSGTYLFGFDDCLSGCDLLIIVEGPREVMKLWQEGYTNSVAIMGAYMSDGQHEMITEINPKQVALMFDGDKAGRMITDRVADKMSRIFGDRTIKCLAPMGRDPKNLNRDEFDVLLGVA